MLNIEAGPEKVSTAPASVLGGQWQSTANISFFCWISSSGVHGPYLHLYFHRRVRETERDGFFVDPIIHHDLNLNGAHNYRL